MNKRTHQLSFVVFVVLMLGGSRISFSEEVLRFAQGLSLLREKCPALQSLRYERDVADAERRQNKLFSNSEVGFTQERISGGGETSKERTLDVTVDAPVSGRWNLERKAADWEYKEREAFLDLERFELENDFKSSFYRLLATQQQVETLNEGLAKVRSLVTSIHGRGGANSYDLLRVNKELSEIESRLEEAVIEKRRREAELMVFLGQTSTSPVTLQGLLNPDWPVPDVVEIRAVAERRPDGVALEARLKKHQLKGRAASRGWIPDLSVTGGRKSAQSSGIESSGYVVGASVDLPLFNRGQVAQKREDANVKLARVQQEKRHRETGAFLDTLHENAKQKSQLFKTYDQTTVRQAEELERMVGLSYLEGKRTLLELLDGTRESLETHLRRVDLAWQAREARISLERAAGIHFIEKTTGEQP